MTRTDGSTPPLWTRPSGIPKPAARCVRVLYTNLSCCTEPNVLIVLSLLVLFTRQSCCVVAPGTAHCTGGLLAVFPARSVTTIRLPLPPPGKASRQAAVVPAAAVQYKACAAPVLVWASAETASMPLLMRTAVAVQVRGRRTSIISPLGAAGVPALVPETPTGGRVWTGVPAASVEQMGAVSAVPAPGLVARAASRRARVSGPQRTAAGVRRELRRRVGPLRREDRGRVKPVHRCLYVL